MLPRDEADTTKGAAGTCPAAPFRKPLRLALDQQTLEPFRADAVAGSGSQRNRRRLVAVDRRLAVAFAPRVTVVR
ncbi:hypothetical protein LY15_001923 [Prauserella flava]|uniref:Uncharacterized protein n=1 Tax=Prauserella sediminis TaxID=577680 RepID=A0A839XQL3_9PSEU|nr:hypothetical protein [Prauserella sediminis]MCR3719949.1 hypothetical protein [Prauserella flava]MCR3736507.1 hypothetical protein [Prauserella salsuginis]